MSRIEPVQRSGLLRRLALRYAARTYRQLPEPLGVWAHHGGVFWTWSAAEMAVQRSWRTLPPTIASLVQVRAASVIGCPWCLDFGSLLATHAGVSEQQLRDLHRWQDSSAFTDAESLALAYADALSSTPMAVTDELVAELRTHFSDAQMVELTAFVALENQRSRFNHGLGITAQGFTTGACALAAA